VFLGLFSLKILLFQGVWVFAVEDLYFVSIPFSGIWCVLVDLLIGFGY